MATISDVSHLAGVSTATVSRVINHPVLVDANTRRRVLAAIQNLQYRPNQMARGLASRSTRTVGIVVNLFAANYYGLMLDGAVAALRELGFHAIVESSGATLEGEQQACESLVGRQCDALILHADKLGDDALSQLLDTQPQTVLMNRYLAGHDARCVWLDNHRGGALAAEYLIAAGHRDIAEIRGRAPYFGVQNRSSGFNSALQQAGLSVASELSITADFTRPGGVQAMQALLRSGLPFSAVFSHNDEMAAGALEACLQAGKRVPQDISIVGFDDIDLAKYITPQLTTVHQPLMAIGDASARLAYALATGQPIDTLAITRRFEPRLIERASVAVVE